jgi:hypothetical protein
MLSGANFGMNPWQIRPLMRFELRGLAWTPTSNEAIQLLSTLVQQCGVQVRRPSFVKDLPVDYVLLYLRRNIAQLKCLWKILSDILTMKCERVFDEQSFERALLLAEILINGQVLSEATGILVSKRLEDFRNTRLD